MKEVWEDDPGWIEFVQHFREDAVGKISESAFVISLVPRGEFDVKFATELGAAIMLDKPVIGIVAPGTKVNERMRRVFDRIIEVDVDTEAGRAAVRKVFDELGLQ